MSESWFLLADRRQARLIRATRTERGTPHLDEVATMVEAWDEKEHGRPNLVGGGGHVHASGGQRHEEEERLRRHARALGAWLDGERIERQLAQIVMFAPPALLGEVRHAFSNELQRHVAALQADLAHLPLKDLAGHPAVVPHI